jgi:predicted dehydrogenase
MTDKIRWGILGPGNIAKKFAKGLSVLPDAELVAVGSRTQENADAFGDQFDVPRRHASYEALAADPKVDVIYVATPHPFHKENTILCLEAGKAVLCEKPFAINAAEAKEMIALAREKKLFLMEAMWTRFLPIIVKVRELLAKGVIGEVQMLNADFCFRAEFDPKSRLLAPHLGGGALLDVGIYPISLASMVFGSPSRVTSLAHLGETGVDERSAYLLGYDGGQLAILSAAIRTDSPREVTLMGTEGKIRIHPEWWCGTTLTLSVEGQENKTIRLPLKKNGYEYEAIEVNERLREGKLESDVMTLDESLSIMQTLDKIREPWGLTYPMEQT